MVYFIKIPYTVNVLYGIYNLKSGATHKATWWDEGGLDQEEHHSVQSLQISDKGKESIDSTEIANDGGAEETSEQERRKKGKWPASEENAKWKTFEEGLDLMMENILVGKADNKLHTMSEIIYTFGKERFCIEQGIQSKRKDGENRRLQKISRLRGDLSRLKANYRCAEESEKQALTELRDHKRKKILKLRRAQNLRRKRHERQRKRAQFTKNPFQFVKRLLGEKKTDELYCTKEEADKYIKEMHNDSNRLEELGECEKLLTSQEQEGEFDCAEPRRGFHKT